MNDEFYMKVVNHHNIVQDKVMKDGGVVLMTCLIGSQNYLLDTPNSDCDTFSFVLPSFLAFIRGDAPKSYEFEVNDGKCMVKDLRLALNLLRKPSPNSVECWVSSYRVYNANYKSVFDTFLNPDYLFFMTHCDYKNMLDAVAGTCRGLHGRNMTAGKKIAHMLRLRSMLERYMDDSYIPEDYLHMPAGTLAAAQTYKRYGENFTDGDVRVISNEVDKYFQEVKQIFNYNEYIERLEDNGKKIIDSFQLALMKVYLEENGYVETCSH